jgi:hypothetical protein
MKKIAVCSLILGAALAAHGQGITINDPTYSVSTFYTDPQANNIVSFDWTGPTSFAYMTADSNYNTYFTGVYAVNSGSNSTVVPGSGSVYVGANVVTIGNYVYFNNSNNAGGYIYNYGPLSGTPSVSLVSTAANYGLFAHNGQLFITASDSNFINNIYLGALGANGSVTSVTDLGITSGASGPLAFDAAGNLYYAPGYGDQSIYKWTAAQLAAAVADPSANPLTVGTPSAGGNATLWASYASDYSGESGATSMLFDNNGNLLVTLTNFGPGVLVNFGTDGSNPATVLTDTDAMGDLNELNGNIYFGSGDQIDELQQVPEPSAGVLSIAGLAVFAAAARLRRRKSISEV